MEHPLADGLHHRSGLLPEERAAVEALTARCDAHDGTALVLHLNPPHPEHAGETQQLLYYEGGQLLGFAGLAGRRDIEVAGMVDPDRRRRGIGRQLYAAARAELVRRARAGGILVCDEATPTGPAFAQALGCAFDFSEHRLRLELSRVPPLGPSPLAVRPATPADVPTLAAISAAAFRDVESDVRRWIDEDLAIDTRRWFHATLDGTPIGNLRVVQAEDGVFITAFGIAPQHQGRGYGRHLLLTMIAQLLAEGRQPIMIEVETDNRNALSLYLACGFVPVHTYLYYRMAV